MIEDPVANQPPLNLGRTALVTGGAGFIGSHIVEALVRRGLRVRVLDDLSTGSLTNLGPEVEFVRGSVEESHVVRQAARGCDHIFHLAAQVSVPQSVADPNRCFEVNVCGTENVIRAAIHSQAKSLVFASSAAVYGPDPSLPSKETDPIVCVSPYAAAKAAGEMLLQAAASSFGLMTISLRLFNVFGARQNPNSAYAAAISAFVAAAAAKRAPVIYGSGNQTRDWVPVVNVVQAFLRASAADRSLRGKSFNVGLGSALSLRQVIALISESAGHAATPRVEAARAGDVEHSRADISRICRMLGYSPEVSVSQGLAELIGTVANPKHLRSEIQVRPGI